MLHMPCPSCGKPLPVGGCTDCGDILICLFCGWPDRQTNPVRTEKAHTTTPKQDNRPRANAA